MACQLPCQRQHLPGCKQFRLSIAGNRRPPAAADKVLDRLPEPLRNEPIQAAVENPEINSVSDHKLLVDKKAVSGLFSNILVDRLRALAILENVTIQSLMGEAFDLLMLTRGQHQFGER